MLPDLPQHTQLIDASLVFPCPQVEAPFPVDLDLTRIKTRRDTAE
ncbi:hypothetical protein [Streptomyces bauhiniae]